MKQIKLAILLGLFPIVILAESSWIGNGSIMSAYQDNVSDNFSEKHTQYPFGVTKDMTTLHSTVDNNVAFFQWFVNPKSCRKLKVYATTVEDTPSFIYPKVNITVGIWDKRTSDKTFKNIKLPFVLGKENVKEKWFEKYNWLVTAIEIVDDTSSGNLYLECTDSEESISSYTSGSKIILDGYRWNGTGSIISNYFTSQFDDWKKPTFGSNPNHQWVFGVFKDELKFSELYDKQVVFFQWMTSDECSELEIDIPNAPKSQKSVKLVSKNWSDSPSQSEEHYVNLPYILRKDDYRWKVIGVYTDEEFSKEQEVKATCVKKEDADIPEKLLSFLSTYFTLKNNEQALKIVNELQKIAMWNDYKNGIESHSSDDFELVLYSLEFFLRHSENVFFGELLTEDSIVNAYKNLKEHYDFIASHSDSTRSLYIKIKEPGVYFGTNNITDADVTIYPIKIYKNGEYTILDENKQKQYAKKGTVYGQANYYSFGTKKSGLYVVKIVKGNQVKIKYLFVPITSYTTIDILLDERF